ncbi:MAG: hypothetical protein SPF99_00180 [Anaerobutyricum sp.]|nr:hypothetical protein [Anaerobutyricum sp.]
MKKIISLLLAVSIVCSNISINIYASDTNDIKSKTKAENSANIIGEVGGFLASNVETVKRIQQNKLFMTSKGHGFAAERANNLYDAFKGIKGEVVGDDFLLNGPDRKIINRNGDITWVQDKYYMSAKGSVEAAFDENGIYKYVYGDDKLPMQLEVPKDQYDDAVKLMKEKISNGKIQNISDPEEAENIVRKGNVTYKQAVNIAKAGNIDSLKYDAANGIISASSAAGISFVLDYAVCRLNGEQPDVALKNAIYNGFKTGGVVFATFVISSQIARTGVKNALVPTTEALSKVLGKEVCKSIIEQTGMNVAGMTTAKITSKVAEVLSKELITDGVFVVVLTTMDVSELLRGRISEEELLKNLTVTIVSTSAGMAGGCIGGAAGSFVLPGAGALLGKIAGSVLAGGTAAFASELVADKIYKSDADEMFDIITTEFQKLGEEYLISEEEGQLISEELSKKLTGKILKDMFESKDRTKYANNMLEPLFQKQVNKREKLEIPSEFQTRAKYKKMMSGVVFIH